jgi:NitT/TauT family transport system permease protein
MSREGWIRLAVVVVAVAVLEAACRSGLIDRHTMIPPSQMLVSLVEVLRSKDMLRELGTSLASVVAAVLMIVVLGFIAGVAIHALPRLRAALDPFLSSYYSLPLFAFYPLLIVLFGIGLMPIILMGFLTGFAAMILATLNGLDNIPPVLGKVARTLRMSRVECALKLQLPAAAPYLFGGVKLGIAYGFIGVIASEFIMSGSGLGYQIGFAYNAFDTKTMYGLILFILLLVVTIEIALHAWDHKLQLRRQR